MKVVPFRLFSCGWIQSLWNKTSCSFCFRIPSVNCDNKSLKIHQIWHWISCNATLFVASVFQDGHKKVFSFFLFFFGGGERFPCISSGGAALPNLGPRRKQDSKANKSQNTECFSWNVRSSPGKRVIAPSAVKTGRFGVLCTHGVDASTLMFWR